ncbi:MAG: putative zinc-binding metallopeptidase [Phycisphaerales bacterium]|nr:MAG: putative zinc-binding metallopeptidase [Phycisphaerales bacterium]
MTKTRKTYGWEDLSDEDLLQVRIRDLKLQIPGSCIEPFVERLYGELAAKGITCHPTCYLADEWLTPDKIPTIGIPFCLAHPRLRHLEQKMMYEVEGGTDDICMKLLRHECGHALNYAYRLYRRTRWRELFGPFSATYSGSYYYQPYSRRFVVHLEDNYAQSHPDEDFAETFAVWLTPDSRWQVKYKNWPVIRKLQYVERIMEGIADTPPVTTFKGRPPYSAARMTSTLAAHYERKRRALGSEFQGYYDDSLRELFVSTHASNSMIKASRLLRSHRARLVTNVTRWTGHRKFDIHQLLNRLATRCDALGLYANASNEENLIGLTSMLTAIASNTLTVSRKRR